MKIADNQDNIFFARLSKVYKSLIVSTLFPITKNSRKSLILSNLNCFNCFSAFQSRFESAFVVSFSEGAACKDFQKRNFVLQKMMWFYRSTSLFHYSAIRSRGLPFIEVKQQ
ncbi:MAG: hypothetical protein IJQ89_05185 [Bacteroidales bacterium]|nr:hypothetical protein [Bacteroidales bacterium]